MSNGTSEKGRSGQQASEGMIELWRVAGVRNQEEPRAGEWVPVRSLVIDDSLTPRAALDDDAVAAYREVLDDLPPITVQKDTFVLIDGRHRLEAHIGISDHIAVVEVDIEDEMLFAAALKANLRHGVRLSSDERMKGVERLIRQHSGWSNGLIAEHAGVHVNTVQRRRQRLDEGETAEASATSHRLGRDGRSRPVHERRATGLELPARDWRRSLQALASTIDAESGAIDRIPDRASLGHAESESLKASLLTLAKSGRTLAEKAEDRAQALDAGSQVEG